MPDLKLFQGLGGEIPIPEALYAQLGDALGSNDFDASQIPDPWLLPNSADGDDGVSWIDGEGLG
jgi:hypothetical protein